MKRLAIVLLPLLYGCGGSGGGSSGALGDDPGGDPSQPGPTTSGLSISLSDAPADGVDHVVLHMDKIVLQPLSQSGGHHGSRDPITVDISGHHVDMLSYQGEHAYALLNHHEVNPGRYQVQLHWTAGVGDHGSYVEDGQGKHPLHGSGEHFNAGEITLHNEQHHSYTLEMDLRQGLHHDENGYRLNEHGMRWVDDSAMGHLVGTVEESWLEECEASHPGHSGPDSQFEHVVYLYPEGTTLEQMDDMALEAEEGKVLPVATSWVHQTHHGEGQFGIGFIPEGNYQIGYTCLGHLDQPDSNESPVSDFVMHRDGGTLTIETGDGGGHRNEHRCGG